MSLIEKLTEEQQAIVDQKIADWLTVARSTKPVDRVVVEKQLKKIYGMSGFPRPEIVWCDSPFQMAALAFVLQLIKRSEKDRACKRWLRSLKQDEKWSRVWKKFDECEALFEKLLLEPRESSLLDAKEAKTFHEFNYPMFEQRYYVDNAMQLRFSPEIGLLLDEQIRTGFTTPMLNSLQLPIETTLWIKLNRMGKRALDSLNSQVCSKTLSESDHQTVCRFKALSRAADNDTVSSANTNLKSTRLRSLRLARSTILPSIMHEKNYFPYIFLNSNLPVECRKLLASIVWPWRDHVPLRHTISCEILGDQAADIPKTLNIELSSEFMKSCLAILPIGNACFVSERPTKLDLDEWGRAHCSTGPAMIFRDGSSVYAWHGNVVHWSLIEYPQDIDLKSIESETDVELRRVLIEVFGEARFIEETGAVIQDQSSHGTLYRKQIPSDDDLVMVKVINSSKEPDGTFRSYFLRVPPTVTTAKEAVAWTFGMLPEEYAPDLES